MQRCYRELIDNSREKSFVNGFPQTTPKCSPGTIPLVFLVTLGTLGPDAPVLVEMLDDRDQPIAGYAGEAAARATQDGIRAAVQWKDHTTLPQDRPVALRIVLPDTRALDCMRSIFRIVTTEELD